MFIVGEIYMKDGKMCTGGTRFSADGTAVTYKFESDSDPDSDEN